MIEGLWSLPWLQRMMREDFAQVDYLTDCDACRGIVPSNTVNPTPQLIRSVNGCPYEKQLAGRKAETWKHRGDRHEYTVCPGYTTKLPEVAEVAQIRMRARLNLFRDEPSELILEGVMHLESADCEAMNWRPPEERK